MTQEERILKHLQTGFPITPLDALRDYGCFRLASVIFNLKKKGHNIATNMKTHNNKRFASYKLDTMEDLFCGR